MTNNEPTKLSGTISYEITLSPEGYSVSFQQSDDLDSIKNALASTSMVRMIASNTVEAMKEAKANNRPFYNEHYKKIQHNAVRTLRELEALEKGIVADLLEVTVISDAAIASAEKAPTSEAIVTIQNEIKEN